MSCAVWWIRRDLRLADNQALHAALRHSDHIVPLFILDPKLLESPNASPRRIAFLMAGLRVLQADIERLGGRLLIRRGDPTEELPRVVAESGAAAVFAEEDYSSFARHRDGQLIRLGVPLHLTAGLTIQAPDLVLKADGTPYTVFTPFSRSWKSMSPLDLLHLLPVPAQIRVPENLTSLPVPEAADADPPHFPAGEAEAIRRLTAFLEGPGPPIDQYHEWRDRPDLVGTSQLSPYFRFGMLSARTAAAAAADLIRLREERQGADVWLNELIWREFFISILANFPHVSRGSFRPHFDQIVWLNDPVSFDAWCQGKSGYPIVDAAMRQLRQTGWMHNRSRMITASFLVKHLLIDWRWGERYFMQQLIDGDPAANNGGWQWVAGTGTDAAPYFRVFNPILQSKKFDPSAGYIKRWLPELSAVPLNYIHEPWRMPASVQRQSGCRLGVEYPAPIVDHAAARARALAAYRQAQPAKQSGMLP